MKTVIDKQKIKEVFERGIVSDVIPSHKELFDFLYAGGRLKIYIGLDPTFTSLHLGHAGNLIFLEDLRRLGHEVIMLIGDFTALIGDPSGRSDARPALSEAQIQANMKDWLAQVHPLLGFDDKENPVQIAYNSAWLGKLNLRDLVHLAANFTVQQMMERDMFEKRLEQGLPIYLHEFLYPLMQGYDSVAQDVNAELCGTDQLFNALAGRMLLKKLKNKDKFVITLKLLQNPKTGEMMSKSRGTGVFLASPADDMYGALLAQPDEMTETLFVHCTRLPLGEQGKVMALGPKEAKMAVAFEIVKLIHGEKAATAAQQNFEKLFSKREIPDDIPELKLPKAELSALELVMATDIPKSKSDARRLIEQGGFEVSGKTVENPQEMLILKGKEAVRLGKKHFFRVIL